VLANLIAMLEDRGHRVLDATSGAAALRIIEDEPGLDLVISDQIMPGMTGFQLSEAIKTARPDLPVIIASGYGELPVRPGRPLRRLAKPFTEHTLAETIAAEFAEV
jgi:CheY-like chemotaxis protein